MIAVAMIYITFFVMVVSILIMVFVMMNKIKELKKELKLTEQTNTELLMANLRLSVETEMLKDLLET